VENINLVRCFSKNIDYRPRVISRCLDDIDALFNNHIGVSNIIWRGDGGEKRDVDSKRFRSHFPTTPDPMRVRLGDFELVKTQFSSLQGMVESAQSMFQLYCNTKEIHTRIPSPPALETAAAISA
jgi:hypothetical protein